MLSCLSYEVPHDAETSSCPSDFMQDLQRSNALPPPLSTAERKSLYKAGRLIDIVASGYQSTTWSKKELSETIDRTLSAAAVAKDMAHSSDIRPGQRISRNRMPRYVSHFN